MIKPSPVTHVHDVNPPHIIKNRIIPSLDEHLTHHGDEPYRFEASGPGPFKRDSTSNINRFNYYPIISADDSTTRMHAVILVNKPVMSSATRDCSWFSMDGTFKIVPKEARQLSARGSQV